MDMGLPQRSHAVCTRPVVFSCGTVIFPSKENLCQLMYKINKNPEQVPWPLLWGGKSEALFQSIIGRPVYQYQCFLLEISWLGDTGSEDWQGAFQPELYHISSDTDNTFSMYMPWMFTTHPFIFQPAHTISFSKSFLAPSFPRRQLCTLCHCYLF